MRNEKALEWFNERLKKGVPMPGARAAYETAKDALALVVEADKELTLSKPTRAEFEDDEAYIVYLEGVIRKLKVRMGLEEL